MSFEKTKWNLCAICFTQSFVHILITCTKHMKCLVFVSCLSFCNFLFSLKIWLIKITRLKKNVLLGTSGTFVFLVYRHFKHPVLVELYWRLTDPCTFWALCWTPSNIAKLKIPWVWTVLFIYTWTYFLVNLKRNTYSAHLSLRQSGAVL